MDLKKQAMEFVDSACSHQEDPTGGQCTAGECAECVEEFVRIAVDEERRSFLAIVDEGITVASRFVGFEFKGGYIRALEDIKDHAMFYGASTR